MNRNFIKRAISDNYLKWDAIRFHTSILHEALLYHKSQVKYFNNARSQIPIDDGHFTSKIDMDLFDRCVSKIRQHSNKIKKIKKELNFYNELCFELKQTIKNFNRNLTSFDFGAKHD